MKKWISIFAAVTIIVLLSISNLTGEKLEKESEFGKINSGEGYFSQVVQCDGKDYILYKTPALPKFKVYEIEKDYLEYEILGTVHQEQVYYLYSFMKEGKLNFGLKPVDETANIYWELPSLETEGEFLAAVSTENEILIAILGNDGKQITEYVLSMEFEDEIWREKVVFRWRKGITLYAELMKARNYSLYRKTERYLQVIFRYRK